MQQAEQGPVAGQGQYEGSRQRIVKGKPRSVSGINRAKSGTSQDSNGRSISKQEQGEAEEHAVIGTHQHLL